MAVTVLVGASCDGGGHHQAVPTTPPTTVPPTSVPATSTTLPATGPYDWVRDGSPTLAIGGGGSSTLAAVLPPSGSRPWNIAGTVTAADGSTTATVWASRNAVAWGATPLTGPQVDSQAGAATTWHSERVVIGSVGRAGEQRLAVWISPSPGSPFAEVPAGKLPAPAGTSVMTSVTGGSLGLFATGTAAGHVGMWYSSNGRAWTELTGAERVIAGADDPHIDSVLATPNGVYAAGWDLAGSSVEAAVWTSGDGVNWFPVLSAQAEFGGDEDHLITALAPLGTGLVAVGGTWTGSRWSPASWISPNGASWSVASSSFAMGARPQPGASDAIVRAISSSTTFSASSTAIVTTGPQSLVAVGGGPSAQRMWTSTDGIHWAEMPLPTAAATSERWQASLLGVTGSTTVVVDGSAGQPHVLVREGSIWSEPSADPAVFGSVLAVARAAGLLSSATGMVLAVDIDNQGQILGQGGASVEFLTSSDATTWTPVAGGAPFADAEIRDLATDPATARSAGEVAVGFRTTALGHRAAVWLSTHSSSWRQPGPLDSGPTSLADQANGLCSIGNTIVAVGSTSPPVGSTSVGATATAAARTAHSTPGPSPRAWYSTDGAKQWRTAAFSPQVAAGVAATVDGCVRTATGLDAYGTAATAGGSTGPAFWSSTGGSSWSRLAAPPFGSGFPFPVADVVSAGPVWLASGGPAPVPGWVFGGGQPGSSALWQSPDGGASWQPVDTSGTTGPGNEPAEIDRVAFFDAIPVLAGSQAGQLAVWTGTPTG